MRQHASARLLCLLWLWPGCWVGACCKPVLQHLHPFILVHQRTTIDQSHLLMAMICQAACERVADWKISGSVFHFGVHLLSSLAACLVHSCSHKCCRFQSCLGINVPIFTAPCVTTLPFCRSTSAKRSHWSDFYLAEIASKCRQIRILRILISVGSL